MCNGGRRMNFMRLRGNEGVTAHGGACDSFKEQHSGDRLVGGGR